ncbi:hypothetical protein C0993_001176 [Termitomyces sp. T159_Od127]|nr:hypothetical protein C0993_001176 [Termitomyces sp. T159_Od127]
MDCLLQLHASLDIFSSLPVSATSRHLNQTASTAFWLDREVVGNALNATLKKWSEPDQDNARLRRIKDIKDESWDLFLRVFGDGSVVVSAVANLDRRPPTLLKQFTLQQLPPSTLPGPPSHLFLLRNPDPSMLTLAVSSPLAIFDLSPVAFFDAHNDGLKLSSRMLPRVAEEESHIIRLVRTPEGGGVGIVRANGGEAWKVIKNGTQLVRSGSWSSADHVVVLQRGHIFVTYLVSDGTLTLHTTPPQSLFVPAIDYLFSIPSEDGNDSIVGITSELSIVHLRAVYNPSPTLLIHSQSNLPLARPPRFILPVDPMAWGQRQSWTESDVLLSVSHTGELDFWVPEDTQTLLWKRTGTVKTGRTKITKASCSSAKKTALRNEHINDLDWTSTPDNQSILAVGFRHRVELLCQQRMTYFDEGPGWATCTTIEIGGSVEGFSRSVVKELMETLETTPLPHLTPNEQSHLLTLIQTTLERTQMEVIARNEYMGGDNRDPTACSLYYFALGKVKLVHGLWRQAVWHKEQGIMLKFLSNDFSEPRWRTAALKNAFTLLSKRRFG